MQLPTSKTLLYDVIIVGAGINGSASAHFLTEAGLKVALIDYNGIAGGGSGAAGAFISPKISKEGPLKRIMEEAHAQSLAFYTSKFPQLTLQKPLLHIAKTVEDADIIDIFRLQTKLALSNIDTEISNILTDEARGASSLFFAEGAVVEAEEMCRALASNADFYPYKADSIRYEEGVWDVEGLSGRHLVLAIGAYPKLLPTPYLTLRGIWGHRIDIETTSKVPCILHHYVSISPSSKEGIVAIGATHDIHYSPFASSESYEVEAGRKELIEKASKTLRLDNINVVKDYCGLRSGSNDYFPMLGSLVDAEATLERYPYLRHGKAVSPSKFIRYPSLTMINGSGGYGFVLAPYLAKKLKEYLVDGIELDPELSPSRFFPRWARKNQS